MDGIYYQRQKRRNESGRFVTYLETPLGFTEYQDALNFFQIKFNWLNQLSRASFTDYALEIVRKTGKAYVREFYRETENYRRGEK